MNGSNIRYSGRLIGDVRAQLTRLLHDSAAANLGHRRDMKRLCAIGMELLDNAERYGRQEQMVFDWRIQFGTLLVKVQNLASARDAERLVATVQRIRSMTAEEIQNAYTRQLCDEGFGEKGGAGLGFLQIARKPGHVIDAWSTRTEDGQFICHSQVSSTL